MGRCRAVLNPNFELQQWDANWKEFTVELEQRRACKTQTRFLGFLETFWEGGSPLGAHVLRMPSLEDSTLTWEISPTAGCVFCYSVG